MSLLKACNGGSVTVAPAVDLTEGLIAHYLLNNNADDSFGNFDGTDVGTVTYKGDEVFFDDGLNGHITTESGTPITTSNTTFSLWAKLSSAPTVVQALIKQEASADPNKYRGIVVTSTLIVAVGRDGSGNYYDVQSPITDLVYGEMSHIAFVEDGTVLKLYIDGVLKGSTDMLTSGFLYTTAIDIVGRWNISDYILEGSMSNCRIYNEAKSQEFVTALYAEGYYPRPLPLPTTDGLVAHYPLAGTGEDTTGVYPGVEQTGLTYIDNDEFGSVPYFDTKVHSIGIANSITLTGNWTLSTWMYNLASGGYLVNELVGGGITSFRAPQISSSVYGFTHGGVRDYRFYGAGNVEYHKWVHVTYRKTSSFKVELLLDGVLKDSTSVSNSPLRVARMNNADPAAWFNGYQRNVRAYDRPITDEELLNIINYEKNFRPIDIDDGLVAYYPLANNSLDNYNNQYDGVDTAMTYDGLSGVFNGTTSQIVIAEPILPSLDRTFSIVTWVNITNYTSSSTLISGFTGTTAVEWLLTVNTNGILVLQWVYQSAWRVVASTLSIGEAGQDMLISVVSSPTEIKFYINDVLHYSEAITTPFVGATIDGLKLGAYGLASSPLGGTMSKIRVYNKAITAEQVEVIYNTEKGDFI